MLHGDLSNFVRASFGFMCEDFLIKYKDNTFSDKLMNAIFGKTKRAEIDPLVASSMEYTYRQTEYNVDLIIRQDSYNAGLKNLIRDLPFCRIVLYNKYSQITSRLLTGDLTYVVDDLESRRGLLNNSHVITLSEFNNMIRSGGIRHEV